jgi:hypothetical protein
MRWIGLIETGAEIEGAEDTSEVAGASLIWVQRIGSRRARGAKS